MPTAPRTASQALAWANARTGWQKGMCLSYVRQAWGLPSYYGRAIDAWNGARRKHPARADDPPPPGAPVFYSGGASGHIVLNQPPTRAIRSTDCPSSGRVSDTDYTWPVNTWGYPVLGWTEDLNGFDLVFDTGEDDDMPTVQEFWSYALGGTDPRNATPQPAGILLANAALAASVAADPGTPWSQTMQTDTAGPAPAQVFLQDVLTVVQQLSDKLDGLDDKVTTLTQLLEE